MATLITIFRSLLILLCLSLLVAAGCNTGKDSVLFVTKTSLGVDFDTTPMVADIGFNRKEGTIAPVLEEGQVLPQMSSFDTELGIVNQSVGQSFATGNAAYLMAKYLGSDKGPQLPPGDFISTDEIENPIARAIEIKGPYSKQKRYFFGTDTSFALRVNFAPEKGGIPDGVNFGYKRKEIAYVPLAGIQKRNENGIIETDDKGKAKMQVALAPLISTSGLDSSISTLQDTAVKYNSFFATGLAASYLAALPEIRQTVVPRILPGYKKSEKKGSGESGSDNKSVAKKLNIKEVSVDMPNEVSGVAALMGGEKYAVVGNNDNDHGFIWPGKGFWELPGGDFSDIESVAVGYNDDKELRVVLSENKNKVALQAKSDADDSPSTWVKYNLPVGFNEICDKRGVEGLAVKWSGSAWKVAVLWEGGIVDEKADCTEREAGIFKPKIITFEWDGVSVDANGEANVSNVTTPIKLNITTPETDHHFRAPDLVWDGDGFIALLASTHMKIESFYRYTWLQKFKANGDLVGSPVKLEEKWGDYRDGCATRKKLKELAKEKFNKIDCTVPFREDGKNWEALDWTADGESLVMGFDSKETPSVLTIFPNPFEPVPQS